jgi:4-amino-4-deoxy-L-arabinose transferase-like glycosyltransferase
VLATTLRVAHVLAVRHSPLGDTLVEDARYYRQEAIRILDHGPSRGVTFMNLGYPYALAAVFLLLGRSVAAALWVQAILGGIASVLVALAARRLTGRASIALLAGGFYAAYAGAVFYDGLVLTPSLTNFCLAVSLYGLAVHLDGGRRSALLLSGTALGLAALLRANALLFLPGALLVAASALPGRRVPFASRARSALVLLAASLALPLAVVLQNGIARGEWAPVSANGGMNFWIGNSADAEGIYRADDFVSSQTAPGEQRAFLTEARRRTGSYSMTISDASAFWLREGLREIRESPRRWLRIEGRKAALFWNAYEAKTNVGMEFLSEFSPVLSCDPVRFSSFAILGIGGVALLLARREWARAALLVSFVAAPWLTCVVFFVSGEYRHPAALPLAIGAGCFLDALLRARRFSSPLWIALAASAASIVLVAWPFPALRSSCHPYLDYANYARQIAVTHEEGAPASRENVERALALLDRPAPTRGDDVILLDARLWVEAWAAVELRDPELARAAFRVARTLLARDPRPRPGGAPESLIRRIDGAIPDTMTEIREQAFVASDAVLAREAELLGAGRYGEFHRRFAAGDFQGALAFLDQALARAPYHVGLEAGKGQVLLAMGRDAEGLEWLRKSCEGWPEIPDCAFLAAEHYAARGDRARAAAGAREALRRDPSHAAARELLSRLGGGAPPQGP